MPAKRSQPQQPAADFSPEKAYAVLKVQLEKLQTWKGRNYEQACAEEEEWYHLTEKLVMRSFGGGSQNHVNFKHGRSAGEHRMVLDFGGYQGPNHRLNQSNYEARLQAYEGALKSSLAELKLDLPDVGIKEVYEPGQEYEFYHDIKAIVMFWHSVRSTVREEILNFAVALQFMTGLFSLTTECGCPDNL